MINLNIISSLTLSLPLFRTRSTPIWMVWGWLRLLRVLGKKTKIRRRRRQDCCWQQQRSPLCCPTDWDNRNYHRQTRIELTMIIACSSRGCSDAYVSSCSDWGGNSSPWFCFCLPAALKCWHFLRRLTIEVEVSVINHQSSIVVSRYLNLKAVMKGGGREGNCDGWNEEKRVTAGLYY